MAASHSSSYGVLQSIRNSSRQSLSILCAQNAVRPTGSRTQTSFRSLSTAVSRSECGTRRTTTKERRVKSITSYRTSQVRALSFTLPGENTREGLDLSTPRRTFHTSRVYCAAHDLSTIDFAYLPDLRGSDFMPGPAVVRVPILPSILSDDAEARLEKFPDLEAAAGGYQATEGGSVAIMKPQIETATAADLSHMSDIGDGQSEEMSIDTLTKLTDILGSKGKDLVDALKTKDEGTVRVLWNSLLDDIFGSQKQKK